MRRLFALFSLLCLTNLVFVQAGSACPLTPAAETDVGAPTGHEGHDMSGAMSHEMMQSAPDESSHSSCPVMNACVVTLAMVGEQPVELMGHHDRVTAASDDRPASLTAVPELPPPRI